MVNVLIKLFKNASSLVLVFASGFFVDIAFLKQPSPYLYVFLTAVLLLIIKNANVGGKVTVAFGIWLYLLMGTILLIWGESPVANRLAIWAFLFIFIGLLKQLIFSIKTGGYNDPYE